MSVTNCLEAFPPNQWEKDDTYYQILLVDPEDISSKNKLLKTTVVTKQKGEFKKYELDKDTRDKINKQYNGIEDNEIEDSNTSDYKTIGDTLPTRGSVFKKDFLKALFKDKKLSPGSEFPEVNNNFYEVFRTLLHSRELSQLIAKTWDAKLQAKTSLKTSNDNESDLLKKVIEQHHLKDPKDKKLRSYILDGLIARNIFLFSDSSEPDELEPPNLDVYYPLSSKSKPTENTRFIIRPNSKGWQSICLSLLMAGQAYYCVDEDGKVLSQKDAANHQGKVQYHQISQSIVSTGEMLIKYALEVSSVLYKSDIKELDVASDWPSPAYLAVLPYPAIPSEANVSHEEIKKWANAKDTTGDLPFYVKDKDDDKYLIGVQNYCPPNPYLPSSCT